MAAPTQKKKAKGRKIGRNAKRPSAVVYKAAHRWEINKVKRMKRHVRRMARKAIHRIEWEARTQRRHLHQSEADRVIQLRHTISQSH